MHPIRVFNGVLTSDFAKEAETRDRTRVLFSCEIVKEAQCSGGKDRLFSFVPNALLVFLSSVFISFDIPKKILWSKQPLRGVLSGSSAGAGVCAWSEEICLCSCRNLKRIINNLEAEIWFTDEVPPSMDKASGWGGALYRMLGVLGGYTAVVAGAGSSCLSGVSATGIAACVKHEQGNSCRCTSLKWSMSNLEDII